MNVSFDIAIRTLLVSLLALAIHRTMLKRSARQRVVLVRLLCISLIAIPLFLMVQWRIELPNLMPAVPISSSVHVVGAAPTAPGFPWAHVVLYAWLALGLVGFVPMILASCHLSNVWAKGKPVDEILQRQWDAICLSHGLRGSARARYGNVETPLVFGLSTKLLLPLGFTSWPAEQRFVALSHEAAHVRTHDSKWVIVLRFVSALYWWNPFVHKAARVHQIDMELAADEAVFQTGLSPLAYAESLLAIAQSASAHESSAFACPIVGDNTLEGRIKAAMRFGTYPRPKGSRLLMVAFSVASMACATLTVAERATVSVSSPTVLPVATESRGSRNKVEESVKPPKQDPIKQEGKRPVAKEAKPSQKPRALAFANRSNPISRSKSQTTAKPGLDRPSDETHTPKPTKSSDPFGGPVTSKGSDPFKPSDRTRGGGIFDSGNSGDPVGGKPDSKGTSGAFEKPQSSTNKDPVKGSGFQKPSQESGRSSSFPEVKKDPKTGVVLMEFKVKVTVPKKG